MQFLSNQCYICDWVQKGGKAQNRVDGFLSIKPACRESNLKDKKCFFIKAPPRPPGSKGAGM